MKKLLLTTLLAAMSLWLLTGQSVPSEVHQYKAFNGIRFEYSLFLPDNYDRSSRYAIIALLCETHVNDAAWADAVRSLQMIDLDRSIVIVPKVPLGNEHWGTHPIHHAFNDLLKSVRKSHGQAGQKFHLIGLEAGQEVAFWWSHASKDLISSTSVINGRLWEQDHWDQKWYNQLMASGPPIYAYEEREPNKFNMSKINFKEPAGLSKVIEDIEER